MSSFLVQKLFQNSRCFSKSVPALKSAFSSVEKAKEVFKNADAVCFDVDSTVIDGEGIDVLAESCGKGEEVAAWTKNAMTGSVPFHVALEERLKLFTPSVSQIEACNNSHKLKLTPGMKELFDTLHKKNKSVFLVSGGFRQMIYPHAKEIGVSPENVYANNILHDSSGNYIGFDTEEPTSRAGGKANVVKMLMETKGFKTLAMVGDGWTDLEARPPASVFVGFGGIVVRNEVKEHADWFAMSAKEMTEAL